MIKRYNWVLDAGHGHNTPGKRSPEWPDGSRLMEYEFNRAVVSALAGMLEAAGILYTVLVPEWHDVPLSDRVARCNALETSRTKILLSIHGNAASSERAEGLEVFTSVGDTLSDRVADVLVDCLEVEFKGEKIRKDLADGDQDKEANFYILKNTRCPAVLSENGFFTNRAQCAAMLTHTWRHRVARAHFKAVRLCEEKGI